jgi:spore coat protein CotH
MTPDDFENLMVHRTGERKYPAYIAMNYPDGRKTEQSIFIKTRGNASKGYIKSSYNIDFSARAADDPAFVGDEFLPDHDTLKLRGFINEETMIHEKLFYDTFKKLGHPAPDFFDATLEINGVPLGLFQAIEPIDDAFFTRRKISTQNFYYAQNVGSSFNTNLKKYVNEVVTLSQYEVTGDPKKLLELIHRLESNDPSLMWSLDYGSIFDYALLVYLTNARDSLTHNFYLYLNEATGKWQILLWDGDMSFKDMPSYSTSAFLAFTAKNEHTFNNLIYYFFRHLDPWELEYHLKNFRKQWKARVDLPKLVQFYKESYEGYFRYDNALWNGKKLELERSNPTFDTMKALEQLGLDVKKMSDEFLRG